MASVLIVALICALELIGSKVKCTWWDDNGEMSSILNGSRPVSIEYYPFLVSIIVKASGTKETRACTGIQHLFFNEPVAIVPGSCIADFLKNGISQNRVKIRSNSEYWDCDCGITVDYQVTRWKLHPNYQEHWIPNGGRFIENNIALIGFHGIWTGIYSINGSYSSYFEQRNWVNPVLIVGWGSIVQSEELREYHRVQQISTPNCKRWFFPHYFPENSFCVAPVEIKGPCYFTEGAIVAYFNTTAHHVRLPDRFTHIVNIHGILVTPFDCHGKRPAIVLNVSKYYHFVNDVSWLNYSKVDTTHEGSPPWKMLDNEPDFGWSKPGNR